MNQAMERNSGGIPVRTLGKTGLKVSWFKSTQRSDSQYHRDQHWFPLVS